MKTEELSLIKSKHNAAIIAPAGHGKTEMIVDLVEVSKNKVLLLTHTNAGIDALIKRLKHREIDRKQYSIATIAGFCMRWCNAYPYTSDTINIPFSSKDYYSKCYMGASLLFQNMWALDVLSNTYECIIVDEYQDCVITQHNIFLEINKRIPVIVLGDPLQAIFGWAGKLVSWNNLSFEIINIQTFPWRWQKTNPALGNYLDEIRQVLMPGINGSNVEISISPVENCIRVLSPSCKYDLSILQYIRNYQSVLYIARWPADQSAFCQSTGGIFQNDEPQGLNYLYEVAEKIDDATGKQRARVIMEFLENCSTKINQELGSFKNHIINDNYDFSLLKKNTEFGNLILCLVKYNTLNNILDILDWIKNNHSFKLYRKELFYELRRSLRYSIDNNISVLESSQKIRMMPDLQKKYPNFKMLSSRTVLSKGLEFECVIIDLEKSLTVTDYYVAMTRATKEVILITDRNSIVLEAPKI